MTKLKLKDVGEFGFIEELRRRTRTSRSVLLGIGDDAAVLKLPGGRELLFTTDMILEDRHFCLSRATAYQIGWKAMAVNLSDIAAMGGIPTHAVVAVGLPAGMTMRFARDLYRGLSAAAGRFKVNIVGGDTNRSDKIVVSVALLGAVEKGRAVKRSGAKTGDFIFVSGALGGSYDSGKHLNFIPRIVEARFIHTNFRIHAMMDISDGLSSDIHRLCQASGVGALLRENAIPVSSPAVGVERALTDGEDFELLFTLGPGEAARLCRYQGRNKRNGFFYPVGNIVKKKCGINLLRNDGRRVLLSAKGFDHFKPEKLPGAR